jgi:DNA-binding GntR family transcriptional regulator
VPAAYRAASQIDDAGLELLKAELKSMASAARAGDEATMMAHDRVFHGLINSASGNGRLSEYVDSLRDLILTRGVSTVDRTRSLKDIVAEHRAIHSALEAGDPEASAAAMKAHLVSTSSLLLQQEGGRDSSVALGWEELVVGKPKET